MNTNDKTLAGVQPGGAMGLGDKPERARFEDWGREEGLPLARGKMGGYAYRARDGHDSVPPASAPGGLTGWAIPR